ncbi:isochorismatase domain-containing protein 2-like [Myxocyprinus asiaticus]|uniref:isochorismatase domain-containing protein 2-like n=1 Tax=Myxocyprinus asiaticus TaxID=70543 RepID=UPI002222A71E|nr:isochorismatase domain-containing protein 2-like [Myxocyprinus asiaticus]
MLKTSFAPVARIGRLSTKGSVLLLCDMQEKFRPSIFQITNIVSNAARLLQACRILGIHQIWTEQYPKGLGADGLKPHAKTSFSMLSGSVNSSLKCLGDPHAQPMISWSGAWRDIL